MSLRKTDNPSEAPALATARPQINTETLDRSLAYSLRRAQLSTYQDFTAFMADFDIRPSQLAVLMLIRSNPGQTQSAISATLAIQKANFVALLDGLEARDLTERRKVAGDRRAFALYLTRIGETLVRKLEAAHDEMEEKLKSRLGPKRSLQLLNLLHEFSKYDSE
jgi:DNA-binding MarR family transcriptional regulator